MYIYEVQSLAQTAHCSAPSLYLLFMGMHDYVVDLKITSVFIWGNPEKWLHTDSVQRYSVYMHNFFNLK